MGFSIDVSSLKALRERLEAMIESADALCAHAATEVSTHLVDELQLDAPFDGAANNGVLPNEEGHLRESFGQNDAMPGIVTTAEVWTNEPIKFGYVTGGTVGPILPVEKQVLWWPDAMHPTPYVSGQQANPFHEKARDTVLGELDTIVGPCIQEWVDNAS